MANNGYALITGASSGIGEEFARQLAARGWSLILVARSKDRLQQLRSELLDKHLQIDVRSVALDLTKPDSPLDLFERTQADFLQVNLLVNNAGFGAFGEFAELDRKRQLQMLDLNIRALVELSYLYLRPMMRQPMVQRGGGGIINIASIAGFVPLPYSAVYAATKAFVISFSQALYEEARQHGVHVMVVNPGTTKTNFFEVAGKSPLSNQTMMQSAAQVVRESLRGLDRGRRFVTTGALNRVGMLVTSWIPRSWVTSMAGGAMRRSK